MLFSLLSNLKLRIISSNIIFIYIKLKYLNIIFELKFFEDNEIKFREVHLISPCLDGIKL